jgi:hypothetical protein
LGARLADIKRRVSKSSMSMFSPFFFNNAYEAANAGPASGT